MPIKIKLLMSVVFSQHRLACKYEIIPIINILDFPIPGVGIANPTRL